MISACKLCEVIEEERKIQEAIEKQLFRERMEKILISTTEFCETYLNNLLCESKKDNVTLLFSRKTENESFHPIIRIDNKKEYTSCGNPIYWQVPQYIKKEEDNSLFDINLDFFKEYLSNFGYHVEVDEEVRYTYQEYATHWYDPVYYTKCSVTISIDCPLE